MSGSVKSIPVVGEEKRKPVQKTGQTEPQNSIQAEQMKGREGEEGMASTGGVHTPKSEVDDDLKVKPKEEDDKSSKKS